MLIYVMMGRRCGAVLNRTMKEIAKKVSIWFFSVIICGIFVGLMGNRVYYKYFQQSSLAYRQDTFRLASKDNYLKNKLKITLNDKSVNEVYITTLSIINNGNAILSRDDPRAESDPLRIEGHNIETVFIDKINTTANSKVSLMRRKKATLVNFKWMNPGDVIVLKVVHLKSGDDIHITGSFKGISKISNLNGDV